MKKDIFVWEPLENNSVFKLVNVNGEFAKDALDHDDINIVLKDNKGIVEIYNRKKKKYEDHVIDLYDVVIWDDILEKLHEVLEIDRETVIHVFPVRVGVFSTNLHYEIVEYVRGYEWTKKFIDGTKIKVEDSSFIEKGYKIGLSLVNKDEVKPLELYSQVGLAEVLGKSRQNIRYHLEKGNLLKPIALVDGRPAWNQDQVNKMLKMKEKGLL